MDAIPPPLDGSLRTLVDFADWHAKHNPGKAWLVFPSNSSSNEVVSLSYSQMNKASHRIAHMVRPNREGHDGEVVALVVNTDIVLYVALLLAVMRAGFVVSVYSMIWTSDRTLTNLPTTKPYPISPRNSAAGIAHMLEAVSSTRVIAQPCTEQLLEDVQSDMASKGVQIKVDMLPALADVLPCLATDGQQTAAAKAVEEYPYDNSTLDLMKPAIYIHSSGSTGFPKSIPLSHKLL